MGAIEASHGDDESEEEEEWRSGCGEGGRETVSEAVRTEDRFTWGTETDMEGIAAIELMSNWEGRDEGESPRDGPKVI